MKQIGPYAKAIIALVLTFLGSLKVAYSGGVTGEEWIDIAIATIGVAAGVFAIPNTTRRRSA